MNEETINKLKEAAEKATDKNQKRALQDRIKTLERENTIRK